MDGEKTNILKLAGKSPNAAHYRPLDTLQDAIDCVTNNEGAFAGDKLIVIALDDREGNFNISFTQANMKSSEILTVLEVMKIKVLKKMNYLE